MTNMKCACGWSGSSTVLRVNPSGINVCPQCGGSGGLVKDVRYSLYPCCTCGQLVTVEDGNYHPWCLFCMNDQFHWNRGIHDLTKEEAERIRAQENA